MKIIIINYLNMEIDKKYGSMGPEWPIEAINDIADRYVIQQSVKKTPILSMTL